MVSSNNGIFLTLAYLLIVVSSFELTLDREQDTRLWKFRGRYFYTESGEDLETLAIPELSQHFLETGVLTLPGIKGLWFSKHIANKDNKLTISYRLTHQLFTQAWISFLAHPELPILVRTNNDVLLETFYSNGRTWCDAVINIGLKTTITIEVETSASSHYFMLDKIILGIFGNITHLNYRELSPCSTIPQPLPTQAESKVGSPLSDSSSENRSSSSLSRADERSESQSESFFSNPTPLTRNNVVRKNKKSLREVKGDSDEESEVWTDEVLRSKPFLETSTQLIENSTKTWGNQNEGIGLPSPSLAQQQYKSSSLHGTWSNETRRHDLDQELPSADESQVSTQTRTQETGQENMVCSCSCSCKKRT